MAMCPSITLIPSTPDRYHIAERLRQRANELRQGFMGIAGNVYAGIKVTSEIFNRMSLKTKTTIALAAIAGTLVTARFDRNQSQYQIPLFQLNGGTGAVDQDYFAMMPDSNPQENLLTTASAGGDDDPPEKKGAQAKSGMQGLPSLPSPTPNPAVGPTATMHPAGGPPNSSGQGGIPASTSPSVCAHPTYEVYDGTALTPTGCGDNPNVPNYPTVTPNATVNAIIIGAGGATNVVGTGGVPEGFRWADILVCPAVGLPLLIALLAGGLRVPRFKKKK